MALMHSAMHDALDLVGSTAAELGEVVRRDYAKWSRLVRETGLKAD